MQAVMLIFTDTDYPFLEQSLASGQAEQVSEPSMLFDKIKQRLYPIIIFDTASSKYRDSIVARMYRRTPGSEFWLLADGPEHALPDYMVDADLRFTIRKSEFNARVKACLRVRALLEDYGLVGKSANLKQAAEMISQVAPTDMSTLVIGPSGSGKEVVARAVHDASPRTTGPFIAFNCGALVESLLESELFGYEKGAFTGAASRKDGIFKRADGGTVFLDEIAETSQALQVKLLRVLEEGSFYRVGGDSLVKTDIRVVAATNRDLTEAIASGDFREDLYFRLGAVRINLAPLSERKADILPLINHFFRQETGSVRGISDAAMQRLIDYGWPGNVRQLRNFVQRMAVAANGGEISESLVSQFIEEQGFVHRNLPVVTGKQPREAEFQLIYQALLSLGQEVRMLRELIFEHLPTGASEAEGEETDRGSSIPSMEEMEEDLIRKTLAAVGGNRREAARRLGIGERTLYRKLNKYGVM
jgi:DNA-binding NtrC family response regulator